MSDPELPADAAAENPETEPASTSYAGIVRSSTIVGGAQGIGILIGMLRTKATAILLGPAGVGEAVLFGSSLGLMTSASTLGIATSGVREIATSRESGSTQKLAESALVLQRISLATGVAGWLLTVLLASTLSRFTFGSDRQASSIALLGSTILMGNLTLGYAALIQGTRRIGDLARQSVVGASVGTVISVGMYWWLGQRGIVPVLLALALSNLVTTWWFVRKIPFEPVSLSLWETFVKSREMVVTGLAFMVASLGSALSSWVIQATISSHFGQEGNGVYAAAWSLSAQFAQFILGAMAADYYPRLASAASDHAQMNSLVNQQTEIGVLMSIPGLLATLAFAPWLVQIFYSNKFAEAALLLPWLVLGLLGRMILWPMTYVVVAKGKAATFAVFEISIAAVHAGLVYLFASFRFFEGVTIAFALQYLVYMIVMSAIVWRLTRFTWNAVVKKMLSACFVTVLVAFVLIKQLPQIHATWTIALLTCVASVLCLRGLVSRLGAEHRISRLACRIPWLIVSPP